MSYSNQDGGLHQRDNGSRTQLFDSKYDNLSGRASSPYEKGGNLDFSQSTLSNLENQSDRHVSAMSEKLNALKSLSLKMGEEIRGSNDTVDKLGNVFEGTSKRLKRTYRDMMKMAGSSRIPMKTWLIIFFVVFLFFFWVWIF
ncbi:LANO_0H19262g1_1 [Lachancea nothofagi CBS 11611]|uniref:LANO_0H19262g1_1 n=1 Tax=Lachancea nothofagi CBS 11611 TaxID=1266666 RepID=A0A1G4KN75_9SACH|nr:LANO_0H19262g1_1 [Lachancea nothofagi CBS 11611]